MPTDPGAQHFLDAFADPDRVAHYADGPRRFVPGFESLHRMTGILLGERAPPDAAVLVLGAGGGLELKALAEAHPGWSFVGVDPSAPMLRLAERTLGPLAGRVRLVQGTIDDAPEGPFDAATCLLTLHFLDAAERTRTAAQLRGRLKPGAPFVAAHSSFPQDPAERPQWLARYAAYALGAGADPEQVTKAKEAIAAGLSLLSPEADEGVLRAAGFTDVSLFFAAFTWRGWVAYA
jgi:tRNA (cmo5U34)-methyltransferase